jgi:hypothetical protein
MASKGLKYLGLFSSMYPQVNPHSELKSLSILVIKIEYIINTLIEKQQQPTQTLNGVKSFKKAEIYLHKLFLFFSS